MSWQQPSTIQEFMARIINSDTCNLLFINYQVQGLTRRECGLVQIELAETLKLKLMVYIHTQLTTTH